MLFWRPSRRPVTRTCVVEYPTCSGVVVEEVFILKLPISIEMSQWLLVSGKEDEDDGRGEVKPVEDPPLLPSTPKTPKTPKVSAAVSAEFEGFRWMFRLLVPLFHSYLCNVLRVDVFLLCTHASCSSVFDLHAGQRSFKRFKRSQFGKEKAQSCLA